MLPRSILIIEDNQANLKLADYLLRAGGENTLTADNGLDGVALAQQEKPSLILCDVQMPGFDGPDVCQALKRDAQTRHIPIVAITAYAMSGDKDFLIAAGFDGYVSKPIDPATFLTELKPYLDGTSDPMRSGVDTTEKQGDSVAEEVPAPRPISVLVVDNTKANSKLTDILLKAGGYDVVIASSVQEAVASFSNSIPDVIMSDIHMPGEDGYDLLRIVRQDKKLDAVVFAFLTSSYWREMSIPSAASLGADELFVRPIDPDVLLSRLSETIKNRRHKLRYGQNTNR